MNTSHVSFSLDELSQAQPIDLLTRLMQALKSGQTTADKVQAYYRQKHAAEYQGYMRQFQTGTLFAAQRHSFEQFLGQTDLRDDTQYWKTWRAGWMCSIPVEPDLEEFYLYRISKTGWRLTPEEINQLPRDKKDELHRRWIAQASKMKWEWQ